MTTGKVYRLSLPTRGIHMDTWHSHEGWTAHTVTAPKNALITIIEGPLDGTRLVDRVWDGSEVMMVTVDIRERGQLV